MIRMVALAAMFFQAAATAAIATQLVIQDQLADIASQADALNLAAPVPVTTKRATHSLLVLNPQD